MMSGKTTPMDQLGTVTLHKMPSPVRLLVMLLLGVLTGMAFGSPVAVLAQEATPTPGDELGPARKFDSTHIKLPDGYRIEPVVINLSVPTTAIFDGNDLLVAESGWAKTAPPRVLRIRPDWSVEVVASEGLEGPVTGSAGCPTTRRSTRCPART